MSLLLASLGLVAQSYLRHETKEVRVEREELSKLRAYRIEDFINYLDQRREIRNKRLGLGKER